MEAGEKERLNNKNNGSGFVYVFQVEKQKEEQVSDFRKNFWMIFPAACASMMCFPYGIMLGWPSPTYPHLIATQPRPPTNLSISADQSAMIAGFLMIGNTVSTPLSSSRRIPSKYGVVISTSLMVLGWTTMWQACNIYYLLASRLLIGLGHGFGLGQLKYYISEICRSEKLTTTLVKCLNLVTISGVVFAFALGPHVDFRQFSITSIIMSVFAWFLAVFLPSTPRELVLNNKKSEAVKLLQFVAPHLEPAAEIAKIQDGLSGGDMSWLQVVRDRVLRGRLCLLFVSVFAQQFSGMPATVVYAQILFERMRSPRADTCALVYAVVYLASFALSAFLAPRRKKNLLLFSAISVSYLLTVEIAVIKEDVALLFPYASLVVMCLYLVCHTVGFGVVTSVDLVALWFPPEARRVAGHFVVMLNSMLALVITKITQVLVFNMGVVVPLYLFLVVSNVAIMFFTIFIPNDEEKINDDE